MELPEPKRLFSRWSRLSRKKTAPSSETWVYERVLTTGDDFFDRMLQVLGEAKSSIEFETYIYESKQLGERVAEALLAAHERGVAVRLLVDGIGSSGFNRHYGKRFLDAELPYEIYHELPWDRAIRHKASPRRTPRLIELFMALNNRDHRKVCIVDGQRAFVGSFNVCDYHLTSLSGEKAWRDTGAEIQGEGVSVLLRAFNHVWAGKMKLRQRLNPRRKRPQSSSLVRLNMSRRQRRTNYLDLLLRIFTAEKQIWITSAYFVPPGLLLKVLTAAADRGVDVRILVPRTSDVFFIPWVTSAFNYGLLKRNVRVYEYLPTMLHAKTMVIDDWAIVGSSNLNHRSLMHDLEADVVLTANESREALKQAFLTDLGRAEEMTLEKWASRSLLERLGGRILLGFRYFL